MKKRFLERIISVRSVPASRLTDLSKARALPRWSISILRLASCMSKIAIYPWKQLV